MKNIWIRILGRFEKRRRGLVFVYQKAGLKAALSYLIFRKYIGSHDYCKRKKKLAEIRKKERITVAFQVISLGKWKSDTVYRAMLRSPRFRPVMWIVDEPGAPEQEKVVERTSLKAHFSKLNYEFSEATSWMQIDEEIKPDIVFICDPYFVPLNMPPQIDNRLVCYVRYGMPNTFTASGTDLFLHNFALFYFMESKFIAEENRKLMTNKGQNIAVTGHPMVDFLLEPPDVPSSVWKDEGKNRKKIIWAPHWTIKNKSFYEASTFLSFADSMVDIAKKYADVLQIAFKPHPNLYRVLSSESVWGKSKTDEYYNLWATMPNTQLETGAYRELFQQSDAMIHDCGSFILEYLLMNKPCMYLDRGDGKQNLNDMNKEALKCYSIGKTSGDIERFIEEKVMGQKDELMCQRRDFCNKYLLPPGGKTAAENILDAILGTSDH